MKVLVDLSNEGKNFELILYLNKERMLESLEIIIISEQFLVSSILFGRFYFAGVCLSPAPHGHQHRQPFKPKDRAYTRVGHDS